MNHADAAVLEQRADPAEPQATEGFPFTPGEFTCDLLSNEQYHSITALSASGIKRLLQSPMHYKFDRENPHDQTESMLLGTALHMAVLEPSRFNTEIALIPPDAPKRPSRSQVNAKKPSPATLDAVAFWNEFDKQAKGKILLTCEQFDRVSGMSGAVRRHPVHDEFLCDGQAEHSIMWHDARLGIPCKARFDYLRRDGIAIDVKSCVDASPDGFARSVASFKYHYQNAWYNNGHEHVRHESLRAFLFVTVESTAPYGCAVYVLEPNAIAFGANRCEEAMLLYKQARDTGYWRGYSEQVQPLRLPRWATTLVNTL